MTSNLVLDTDIDSSDRNATIAAIRHNLKTRSGHAWSVTGGRGTAWGWITIKARGAGYMTDEQALELSALLGETVHAGSGTLVPASSDYRAEYVQRSAGVEVTVRGERYWD